MIEHQYSSYLDVTAAISMDAKGIAYDQILEDVHCRDKMTFSKIISRITANTALANNALHTLETERQRLKYQIEKFLLVLDDLKTAKIKSLTEEQAQQRLAANQTLESELKSLKIKLAQLDKEITYITDCAEDQQKRFMQKMQRFLNKIITVQTEKIELITAYLQQQNITIDIDEKRRLIKILNHPDIQSAYFQSAGLKDSGSFMQKLKRRLQK